MLQTVLNKQNNANKYFNHLSHLLTNLISVSIFISVQATYYRKAEFNIMRMMPGSEIENSCQQRTNINSHYDLFKNMNKYDLQCLVEATILTSNLRVENLENCTDDREFVSTDDR